MQTSAHSSIAVCDNSLVSLNAWDCVLQLFLLVCVCTPLSFDGILATLLPCVFVRIIELGALELCSMVVLLNMQVPNAELVDSYFDHSNWCVILRKRTSQSDSI